MMDNTRAVTKSSQDDPVTWLIGTTATGIVAAITFFGTAIIAL